MYNWQKDGKKVKKKEKKKIELYVRLGRVIGWQHTQCLHQEEFYQSGTSVPHCKGSSTNG